MKKVLALVLTVAMIFSLSAMALAEEHEPVTIEWMSLTDSTGFPDALVEAFEAEYPWITVEINYIPGNTDDVKKALITSMVAQDSNPDVFLTDVVWTGQFAAAGWIKDLNWHL